MPERRVWGLIPSLRLGQTRGRSGGIGSPQGCGYVEPSAVAEHGCSPDPAASRRTLPGQEYATSRSMSSAVRREGAAAEPTSSPPAEMRGKAAMSWAVPVGEELRWEEHSSEGGMPFALLDTTGSPCPREARDRERTRARPVAG